MKSQPVCSSFSPFTIQWAGNHLCKPNVSVGLFCECQIAESNIYCTAQEFHIVRNPYRNKLLFVSLFYAATQKTYASVNWLKCITLCYETQSCCVAGGSSGHAHSKVTFSIFSQQPV